jgi:uncharacterized protein (DUF1501 family)
MNARDARGLSRRSFLKLAGAAGASAGLTLLLPKRSRGAGPAGPVKRVLIIVCGGGVRWTCSFDGQADLATNPWGVASWGALGSAHPAPSWGFGRMLMQKPVLQGNSDWSGSVLPYLRSDANFNVARPILSSWGGKQVPAFADVAHETAVVRCNNNPAGEVNLDHRAAGTCMFTGSTAGGAAGIVTAMYDGLKRQMGAALDGYYALPPVTVGAGAGFSVGVGAYASSRPLILDNATQLPDRDPTANVSRWGRQAEVALDQLFAQGRVGYAADRIANLVNDKAGADAHGGKLLDPVLRIGANPTAALGQLVGGATPVSNAMLGELFGISSDVTPAGDILFDAYTSNNQTSWAHDLVGYNSAFAVRLLQMGAPIVAVDADGLFDSHAGEVQGDPRGGHAMGVVRVARGLAALELALKQIVDPKDAQASLWDSTVVLVCSEFGRPGGFNVGDGGTNGGGSDHGPWNAWPILGGPVVQGAAGGKVIQAGANGGFYHQNQLYTTLMAGMGIESANSTYLQYFDHPPIKGLFAGVG